MTTAQFAAYDAIALPDATCGLQTDNAAFIAFTNSAAAWGAAVDGNVIVIGTDEVYHDGQGGDALMDKATDFVVAEAGKTGAYISLGCVYNETAPAALTWLDTAFGGTWGVNGIFDPECFNDIHIVATHPALTGLTDANLENWSCSVHEAFTSWATDFEVLAIAQYGNAFTAADGTIGTPYIVARGVEVISDIDLTPATDTNPVGTTHTVTATLTQDDPNPGTPIVGAVVTFSVISGPNTGTTGTCAPVNCTTPANGIVTWTYLGDGGTGTDTIKATFVVEDVTQTSNEVTKLWEQPAVATLTLTPATDTNELGQEHCVTATAKNAGNVNAVGIVIRFSVTPTANHTPTSGSGTTNASGQAQFCYTSYQPGTDTITAYADTDNDTVKDQTEISATAAKTWILPAACQGMTFNAYLVGTAGNDTISGTGLAELIFGLGGNDNLSGGAGNDCILGGEGNDTITGGSGNDRMTGDGGTDNLTGDSGTDTGNGGAGTDTCNAESETACEI